MDRIADSGSVGWGFESLRGHSKPLKDHFFRRFLLLKDKNLKFLKTMKSYTMLKNALKHYLYTSTVDGCLQTFLFHFVCNIPPIFCFDWIVGFMLKPEFNF